MSAVGFIMSSRQFIASQTSARHDLAEWLSQPCASPRPDEMTGNDNLVGVSATVPQRESAGGTKTVVMNCPDNGRREIDFDSRAAARV